MIRYYMNLHIITGPIPDIAKKPQQALLMLGRHQHVQDDLKAFLRFSNDHTHFTNLHTEKKSLYLGLSFFHTNLCIQIGRLTTKGSTTFVQL